MRLLIAAALLLTNYLFVRAETFIGPSSPTNRLLVASNEAILISTVMGGGSCNSLITGGTTNVFTLDFADLGGVQAYAVAGPSEIILGANVCFSFQRFQNTTIQMLVVPEGQTNSVAIPTNKTLKFFLPLSGSPYFLARIERGSLTADSYVSQLGEFSGPANLYIRGPVVVSYYFTENSLVLPEARVIQGPTGSFEIAIEKSYDLTNWFPVVIHNSVSDQRAFFKLRLSR